jgi:hypothetical protein
LVVRMRRQIQSVSPEPINGLASPARAGAPSSFYRYDRIVASIAFSLLVYEIPHPVSDQQMRSTIPDPKRQSRNASMDDDRRDRSSISLDPVRSHRSRYPMISDAPASLNLSGFFRFGSWNRKSSPIGACLRINRRVNSFRIAFLLCGRLAISLLKLRVRLMRDIARSQIRI